MQYRYGTALITGASSGIGKEVAQLLAQRGHSLVLVARSANKLNELADTLTAKYRVEVHTCPIDLAEHNGAQRVLDFTLEKGIEIAVLVSNAGVGLYGEHSSLKHDELNKMLQLNIIALSGLCHLFGERMKRQGKGWILNIASTAAYQPTPLIAAYGASKSFVLNFSEALAKEMKPYGVIVSCLSPGPTDTAFFDNFDEHALRSRSFGQFRVDTRKVAKIGINNLWRGKLSKVVGFQNYLLALSVRFVPRSIALAVSQWFLKPRS